MADQNNTGNNSEPADNRVGSLDIDDNQSVSFYSSQSQQYPIENLEVHDPNAVNHSNKILHPLGNSFKFSRRKAMVVSLVITLLIILLTAVAMLFLVRYSAKTENNSKLPTQQDVTLKDAQDSVIPKELQGSAQSLLVNGDLVARGVIKISDGSNVTILKAQSTSGNQTITLPSATGTLCLDSNNCNFAGLADLTALQGQVGSLTTTVNALSRVQIPTAGVTDLNGQKGSISIQGSLNQISVSTNNGVVTLSTPQNLDANANVQFGNLTVSQTGQIKANKLVQTGAGNSINIDAGNDFITFTAGGRVFQLPNSGGAAQTICTTGASCASGGGTAVLLASGSVQNEADPSASIWINDTGGGNLLQLQTAGVDKFTIANNGNTTVGGSLTVSGLGNGFVKSTGGALSVVGSINLASDVTGTLPVSNGGIGLNTIPANGVLVGNGASPVSSVVAGGAGLCLMSTAGAPSFQACPGSGGVTSLNGQAGVLTVAGTANQVNVNTAAGTITLSTPQNIHVAATPTFAGLTLSGLGTGPVRASAGLLGTGNINLGSEVSGLLGVTFGGTGVSTTPSNGQLLIGNGTGYTVATLTAGAGISITNGGGSITISSPSAGSCATCANQALSNLSGVALNTSLLTGSTTIDLGSNAAPFRDLYLGGSATNNFRFTGVATAARTITVPNASGTLAISASGNIALDVAGNLTITGQIPLANGGTGSNTAAGARTNLGAAASGANSDITSTTALNTITPSSTLTIGATGQILTLQGAGGSTFSAGTGANITTLGFAAPTGTNTITFPTATGTVCISSGNCATAGAAGGDLTGTYPNPTIAKLQGTTLNISGAAAGHILIYNATNGRWENHAVTSDITLSETGVATIANSAVTTAKIADGNVTNIKLANSSLTVTAGNGLSGGGAVSLGASTSLAVVYGSTANTAVQGNTAITLTAGTGLTGGGSITLGTGGTSTLNVAYGSTAGTAVEGNKTLTCASGTGNLTGGGNIVTLGAGGTCNNLTITNSPVFSGTLAVQGATVTIGASGQQGSTVLYDGGVGVAANTGTVQVIGSLGQDTTYILPDPAGATATICLSTGNCAGAGGGITGSGTSGKLAKFNGSGTITDSSLSESGTTVTATGNVVIQGSNSLTIGTSSSFDGSIKFYNAAGTHFVALQAPATDPAADLTFKLPSSYGSNGDCLQSNGTGGLTFTSCTGGAGGGVTSLNSQTGVVNIANSTASAGVVTLNDASTTGKGIAQFNNTNFSVAAGVVNTIQNIDSAATPTFAGLTLSGLGNGIVTSTSGALSSGAVDRNSATYLSNTLNASNGGTGQSGYTTGDLLYASAATTLSKLAAVAAGQCLVSNGVGTAPSWSVCPGGGGVSSLNTFTGAVTVQGTTNQVIVNNSAGTITLSTPQDINTSSTPQFSGLGLTAGLTFSGVVTDITTGLNQDLTLDANGTGKTILSDAVDIAGLLSSNGGIQTNGAAIATSNGALTLGSGNLTTTGTITSGLINGQTISSAANFTGTVAIQGANSLSLGTSSSLDGSIAFKNAAGIHSVSLQAPTTDPAANFSLKLPSAGPTGAGDCLLSDASGNLYFATCPGSGGIASINGETGPAITIANASALSNTITINDATTAAKGIASFSSTNFAVSSGNVTIKAGGVGSTEIADGSITGTDIGASTVTNTNLVNSSLTVNAGTNLTGGGAVSLGGNITLNVASSPTFSGNVTVQGGTTTLGASGQQGSAIFYNGGAGVSAHTGTVQVIGTLGQDTTYTLPDPGSASTTICVSTGNCAGAGGGITGSGTNGQVAYFNGSGTITSSANLLFNGTDVTVAGTVSGNTLTSTVATGTAPLTVASTTLVTNFNADLLDGQHGAFYQDAGNLNAGVVASARISGSYTGITGVGTISTGTWQGSAIADAYLQDNITVSALGTVDWSALNNYPAACSAGQAVTQLGDSITCAAFAAGSGSGNYIQNNTGPVQAGASFWIDGTGRADTKLQTPLLDTATAVALNIGTTNATVINLNKNVVVAASQSLTITGGITGTRPASPTDGMLYYDTTTKQLLVYSASKPNGAGTGGWQTDRSIATKIIAPSNASQTAKDSADVVLTGTADQTLINNALTAAAGGKVYIMEGQVNITGSISIPNNTTLAGAGMGTLITIPNALNANFSAIINTDQATGTGVTIQDLKLDGNKSNQSGAVGMAGIDLNKMGSVGARKGAIITNVQSNNWYVSSGTGCQLGVGICFRSSDNNTVTNSTAMGDGTGIMVTSAWNNIIANNTVQANTGTAGIYLSTVFNNTITGNTAQGNTGSGIYLDGSSSTGNTITGNTAQSNTANGFFIAGGTNHTITGNTALTNATSGININATNNSIVAANKLYDNGGAANNNGINITSTSSSNTITGNAITDSSCTTTCYAISIALSSATSNYLASNTLGNGTINDAGTGTIYGGQVNSSGNFLIQPAGTVELMKNTNVTGNLAVTGTGSFTGGSVTVASSTATQDRIVVSIAAVGAARFDGTITNADLTAARTWTLPDETGTFCMQGSTNCGFATSTGSGSYIQNQNASQQASANFWIGGIGRADTSFTTPLIDTATAAVLNIGTTNATAINLNKNVVVAASQSLTLTGGATASRPASPTDGMMYYDTTTKQLLVYNATKVNGAGTGGWQAARSTATKIVAASNSSQQDKDAADYVATGTDDATTINSAINALPSGGGAIYLMAGTYTMGTTSVSVLNNTTIAGAGTSTLLKYANSIGSGTYYMIRNSDTATGTHVAIRDLMIDGNKANNTAPPTTSGIYFQGMGSSTADGGKITNVTIKNMNTFGIQLLSSQNNTISGNTVASNNTYGIYIKSSNNNTVTGNVTQNNGNYGIYVEAASYNTISGNTSTGNTTAGIILFSSAISNTVTGNTTQGSLYGIQVFSSSTFNVVSGNNITGNTTDGIYLSTSADNNVISGNKIHDSGGTNNNNGIYINTSDGNTITGNNISDTSATVTNYAINVSDSGSNNTSLANNVLGTGIINNLGTNTIYNSQVNGSGVIVLQDTSGINLNSASTIAANLTVTNAGNVAFQKGTDYATTGTTNNVNFGTGALFRLTGASAQTITGIANGADGRMITLINAAAQTATIANNSASSTAANRIITGTGANMTLASGASISLVYDSGASFWRVVGSTSAVGGGTYVNLQASTPGTADTGNFNITGTGIAATLQGSTNVLTPAIDVISAGTLSLGTSTATAINIGKSGVTTAVQGALTVAQTTTFSGAVTFSGIATDITTGTNEDLTIDANGTGKLLLSDSVVVAASQSLTLTGGNTASRPASPTDGMMYYDTTTKQLLVYNATKVNGAGTGGWQADRSTSTKIVAASNSSQALKDAADYVATGTGDQAQINAALTAAAGGKVYLAEGTYTINASISIPNSTTLVGAGAGTVITIPNSFNASINAITNTDTTTGTGVTVSNLQLDGNKANQASGVQKGIYLNGMGNGPGGTSRAGATISNLKIVNFTDNGIMLNNSDNNDVTNNYLQNNTANDAIFLQSSNLNTIHGNFMQGNGSAVYLYSNSNNNKVFGNTSDTSNYAGFTVSGSFENDFSENIARDTATGSGFFLDGANRNTFTSNTVTGTTNYPGFWLYNGSSENTLTGNVSSTNKEGIDLGSGTGTPSNNTITANIIKDSASYGIFLGGDNNIVSNNTIQNSGGATDNNGITTLTGSSNTITANKISDTSATTTNYAINISNGTSNTNYLAGNTLGSGTINDAGTGTIYGGQVNSSGNFVIQPAGTIELMKNTNVTGNLAVTGTGSFTGGSVTVATATATDDRLVVSVATGGAARFDGTITNADLTAARTWTLPNESGTICIVGSTSCLSGAGFVQFAPASVQADTTTNTSIFINKTGASGNIIDLQKGGVDLFTVNSTGAIQLGSTGNGITLSGSGGVTTGSFTLNGTARNTKTITMNAEYAGAVLDAASDSSCSAANNGTLTSGFTTTGTNSKPEGYYTWSSTQGTAQCYDVVVQVPLPSDFDGFTGTQSVNVWSSNTTNGTVVMDKNVNGTTDGSAYGTTLTPGSASTWTNQTFTFAGSYTSANANQMLTIRIRMSSLSSAQVNLGRITLQYYSKF